MKPLVIGIGELLWDLLPEGPQMGGAPANFACHAGALGMSAGVISGVGADEAGAGLLARLEALGVRTEGIAVHADLPTGAVGVAVDEAGQPSYTIHAGTAWDRLVAGPRQLALAARADAVCFGTLAQRSEESRAALRRLVGATPPEALRVLDLNLREPFFTDETLVASLEMANVLKLNEGELGVVARVLGLSGGVRKVFEGLIERFELRWIAYTRGAEGSVLFDGVEWCEHAGCEVRACDTVGAGDSFTAAVVTGLLRGWPLAEISGAANEVAAFVCSRAGAVPELPEGIRGRWAGEGRDRRLEDARR